MVIVAVVLLLLGPDKLPEVAHKLGSSWRSLKRLQERVEAEVREAIPDLPSSGDIARIARSPVNLLNSLANAVDAKEDAAASAASAAERPTPAPMETNVTETPVVEPPKPRPDSSMLPPDPSMN
jgi:Sec-independent protein translocase protein TatA